MKNFIKRYFIFIPCLFVGMQAYCQTESSLHEMAKLFMRQGDYTNAILILTRCVERGENNIGIQKDLAQSYMYAESNEKALETIKPLLESKDADDQCYLLAGSMYRQLQKPKECEKIYRKGVKAFPESGPLYNELGEVQIATFNKEDAIKNWEKGIQFDPSFPKNYYNASKYYSINNNLVWALLYGEIFVNMQPKSTATAEVKQMLLDGYKQLFLENRAAKKAKERNEFAEKYIAIINKLSAQADVGISVESLSMIRSLFILQWFADDKNPSFKLFDYQKQLLKEGMFEAYNQWLFGTTENIGTYQNWTKTHVEENNNFLKMQSSSIFKMPIGQYYR